MTVFRYTGLVDHNGSEIDLNSKSCKPIDPNEHLWGTDPKFGGSKYLEPEFKTRGILWLDIGPYEGHEVFTVTAIEGNLSIYEVESTEWNS